MKLVEAGVMPRPKRLGGLARVAWCRHALDHAIDVLPDDGRACESDTAVNPWTDLAA
ncbi:MAG: hypothetical protein ACFE0R_16655 [Salinarimonas sp.]